MKATLPIMTVKMFSVIASKQTIQPRSPNVLDSNTCTYDAYRGLFDSSGICRANNWFYRHSKGLGHSERKCDKSEMYKTSRILKTKSSSGHQSTSPTTAPSRPNTAPAATRATTKLAEERQNTTLRGSLEPKFPTIDLGHSKTLLEFGLEKCNCSRKLSTFRKVLIPHLLFKTKLMIQARFQNQIRVNDLWP